MAPMAMAGMLSPIGVQLRPALTVCQTPPVAAPRKTSLELSGLTARTDARPEATLPYQLGEMGAGPIGNHVCPLMVDADRAGVESVTTSASHSVRKGRGRRSMLRLLARSGVERSMDDRYAANIPRPPERSTSLLHGSSRIRVPEPSTADRRCASCTGPGSESTTTVDRLAGALSSCYKRDAAFDSIRVAGNAIACLAGGAAGHSVPNSAGPVLESSTEDRRTMNGAQVDPTRCTDGGARRCRRITFDVAGSTDPDRYAVLVGSLESRDVLGLCGQRLPGQGLQSRVQLCVRGRFQVHPLQRQGLHRHCLQVVSRWGRRHRRPQFTFRGAQDRRRR